MGRGPTNENTNMYFQARKKAATYNERLWSREGAAELLGISVSTLADYELGNTKVVPVDKVVLMADLYNAPELITGYCMRECPVHGFLPLATEEKSLEPRRGRENNGGTECSKAADYRRPGSREKYRLCVREGVQHHRQQVFIRKAADPHYEYDIEGYAGVRGHPIQTYL